MLHVYTQPLLSQVKTRHLLPQLESRANSETDNPRIQAKYLEAVVDEDPHYVVRRFESGRFAVDSQVRQVYQRALTMTEKIDLLAEEAVTTRPTLDSVGIGSNCNAAKKRWVLQGVVVPGSVPHYCLLCHNTHLICFILIDERKSSTDDQRIQT